MKEDKAERILRVSKQVAQNGGKMENDMLKIAVCDDEKIILEQIKRYVEAFEVPSYVCESHSGEGSLKYKFS